MKTNMKAMRELELLHHTCNTTAALVSGTNALIRKYQASERITKRYGNGLVKVAILDKEGLLIGEYTRAA